MATFSLAELVLNEHLTNTSNYNPTTMTNSSLVSLSSVKVSGNKRKLSRMPDILSSKAGQAKRLLKKFSRPFVTSSDDVRFSPNNIVPNDGLSALGEHSKKIIRPSPEKISSVDNIGLKQLEMYHAMGNRTLMASRSPKAVCFDSMSSTKWSRLEISLSPKKCDEISSVELCPQQRDVVSSSHLRASRMLRWDEFSTDGALKKVLPRWPSAVESDKTGEQRMPCPNGTRRECMPLKNDGATNVTPTANNEENKHVGILRHHHKPKSSSAIKRYKPSSVAYKNLFTNAANPLLIKNVYSETPDLKDLLDDPSFFSENINTSTTSKTVVQPTEGAIKTSRENDKEDDVLVENGDTTATESSMLNRGLNSIRMKSTKSLLFIPFPNVPFKIKAIQPINARFEVYYTESSMIPTVKTAGEQFEAKLQEITIDSTGQEGFRCSPSAFCCTISVNTSDSVAKFEEIKKALRVVCDAYNLGVHAFKKTSSKVFDNRRQDCNGKEVFMTKYPTHNTAVSGTSTCAADFSEVLTEQYNLQASSVDHDNTPAGIDDMGSVSSEQIMASKNQVSLSEETMSNDKEGGAMSSDDRREAISVVRRSHRKFKTAGLWKERNAYATRVTRPTLSRAVEEKNNLVCPVKFIDEHKYLDRTMLVNQFIQDVTGVPVVVLERLSSEELQGKLSTTSGNTGAPTST